MIERKKEEINPTILLADKAFKEAVAEVLLDHKRKGLPIVISRNGKIVHVPADEIVIKKPEGQ